MKQFDYVKKFSNNLVLEFGAKLKTKKEDYNRICLNPIDLDIRWKGDHKGFYFLSEVVFASIYFSIYNVGHDNG